MGRIIEAFKETLQERNIRFSEAEEGKIVLFQTRSRHVRCRMVARAEPLTDHLIIRASLAQHVAEEHRAETAKLLGLFNLWSQEGCWALDHRDGEVVFKLSANLSWVASVRPVIGDTLIKTVLSHLQRAVPRVAVVSSGLASADDTLTENTSPAIRQLLKLAESSADGLSSLGAAEVQASTPPSDSGRQQPLGFSGEDLETEHSTNRAHPTKDKRGVKDKRGAPRSPSIRARGSKALPRNAWLPFEAPDLARTARRIRALPQLSPSELDERLLELGYRGQQEARRAAALLAYQHVQRLRAIWCEALPPRDLPPQDHYFFVGPSGSGKTHLVELLFRDILKLPTVIVDATHYSETGYAGEDVPTMLTRLYQAAGQDQCWACCGVVCIDELDKVGRGTSPGRDVGGEGVQRGLLTLLGSQTTEYPRSLTLEGRRSEKLVMPLHSLSFIGAGAFSCLQEEHEERSGPVGFGASLRESSSDHVFQSLKSGSRDLQQALLTAGMLPELLGRFGRIVPLRPLDQNELRSLLTENLLPLYVAQFAREKVKLVVSPHVSDELAAQSVKLGTGARGLRSALAPSLADAAFQSFGHGKRRQTVYLDWQDGSPTVRLAGKQRSVNRALPAPHCALP